MKLFLFTLILSFPLTVSAQLMVTVKPPKVIGQKAIVTLAMTNNLADKVKSARAICFLLNDQGKMVGASSKWVVGGTRIRPALEPKKATSFNFVITTRRSFVTTNLTAKVSFTRVILEGDKLADPKTDVEIKSSD